MEAIKGKKSSVARRSRVGAAAATDRPRRSAPSSSPATPAWAPRRWAPRCSARRSRTPGTPRSRSSTRRSPTSRTATTSWSRHQDLTDRARQRTPSADARLGRQLHGQPTLRRDRRADRTSPTATGAGGPGRGAVSRTASADDVLARAVHRARRPRPGPGTKRSPRPATCWSRRRGRPGVRRRHARAREVGLHGMGNRLAIPHGTNEAKAADPPHRASRSSATTSRSTGRAAGQYVVGIAGAGDDHLPCCWPGSPETFTDRRRSPPSTRRRPRTRCSRSWATSAPEAGRDSDGLTARVRRSARRCPMTSSSSGSVRSLIETPGTSRRARIRVPSTWWP